MPFIKPEDRAEQYEPIIKILKEGFQLAVAKRDKSHINFVISRALMLAWKELGWGYNNGSDLQSIMVDVDREFQRRRDEYEELKQKENTDIIQGFEEYLRGESTGESPKEKTIKEPKPEPKKRILDQNGKEIK